MCVCCKAKMIIITYIIALCNTMHEAEREINTLSVCILAHTHWRGMCIQTQTYPILLLNIILIN